MQTAVASPDPTQQAVAAAAGMGAGFIAIMVIIVIGLIILQLAINWRIASKAGYEGALSLLMLVPLLNLIIILIFAFSEWPIEKRLKALTGGTTTTPLPPGA
jgi:hypothetical protein